jgi:hypothetical protein
MNVIVKMFLFLAVLSDLPNELWQTHDFSGVYFYSIVDTPYGDYFGKITFRKRGNSYESEIINEDSVRYDIKVIKTEGTKIIFRTNLENSKSTGTCEIIGDSIRGNLAVKGDDFNYILKGKKIHDR